MRPKLPAGVARQLRQESGFGCANCGNPILDYHHIVEWRERPHFEPEHMVALCPNCHRQFGKMSPERAYAAKRNPFNIRHKKFKGYLGGNSTQKALKIGAMVISDCESAVNFGGISIFSYALHQGEFLLSATIPKNDMATSISVTENWVTSSVSEFWDIEYKENWIKFRRGSGDIFFAVDFRGDYVTIESRLVMLGQEHTFAKDGYRGPGGNFIGGGSISNCKVGFRLGPAGRIFAPNFAMKNPAPLIISE